MDQKNKICNSESAKTERRRLRRNVFLIVAALIVTAIFVIMWSICRWDRRRKKMSVEEFGKSLPVYVATAPLNLFYEKYSYDDTSPIVDISDREDLVEDLLSNWKAIRDEAIPLYSEMGSVQGELFFKRIVKDDKWRRMYLKWYGDIDEDMREKCPITCDLIEKYPDIHLAMFSLLKSGGRILPHAGPFRGCLRIHVGLDTPNSDDCYINIGDERYSWRDGEIVAFDDTYRHEVYNNTDKDRLVLFMDLERKMMTPLSTRFNKLFIKKIAPLTTRSNQKVEKASLE